MIRKIVITLLLGACVWPALAQRPLTRVEWGVIGGINVPDYTTNMSKTDVKNKLGWQAGITTAVNLGAFAIEPQILYVRQGLRIRPEGGSEINLKSNSIDVPVLASLRLLNPVRIYAGPVFTVMNDCKQKSGGDLLDFGRVRPSVSYTVGAGIVLMRHLLIDLRYNGQFRSKHDVVLPDGSRVRLNGGTRIVYPALFGDERRVEVDGEAYFEVEHDARRPFVVVTGQVVSTVLGPTFNVHAYSEDENYQITLATGSLLVDGGPESRSVRLRPGEQGFFERTSGLLSLRRVNVEQVLSWQEDRLYFRAEPLASIARSLERQFNVDITIPDERLRRICFTGEFVDGENIHEIMRIISADSRILCRSRKNHFELYRNR